MQRQWQHDGWLAMLLRPLAALTSWHVKRRRAQYVNGRRPVYRAPVPVVVIGNIYVGGTGKTPVVIATVQALRERGWTPGVVSRGYGAKIGPQPRVGHGELNPADFGDEPALIAHTSGAPVAVHPRRALAAQALLERYPQTDVIVSDDGLQHLALARDAEIVVQDERGVGNGHLLPAGPLREPASRLNTVDAIITNRSANGTNLHASPAASFPSDRQPSPPGAHVWQPTQSAASNATESSSGPSTANSPAAPRQTDMQLRPDAARQISTGVERPLADFADPSAFRSVAAAAGIGNPDRFFATLQAAGIQPTPCLALPDHYDYRQSPFEAVQADAILITSKDAIKCRDHCDARLWEIPVQAQFSDPTLFDWLDQRLRRIADAR
ncbi:tetraacyldisaccharide 4'-kinase [Bordetella muralis]|uniref:tetraacyldisaccharide 4'-kinase n=1 Tax=Bordetella muralis TaxID=1649130 RepID=UPI0039F09B15